MVPLLLTKSEYTNDFFVNLAKASEPFGRSTRVQQMFLEAMIVFLCMPGLIIFLQSNSQTLCHNSVHCERINSLVTQSMVFEGTH